MTIVRDDSDGTIQINTEDCRYCKGNSAVMKKDHSFMTSQEWCSEVGTCAATIDWDAIAERHLGL